MKRYFKSDFKRIGHASRVARYAERIQRPKRQYGGYSVCAFLHDIGIRSERNSGSTAARFQELEGPPIARSILIKLGAKAELIDEVCDIVGHHHHPGLRRPSIFRFSMTPIWSPTSKKTGRNRLLLGSAEPDDRKSFLTESGRKVAEKHCCHKEE